MNKPKKFEKEIQAHLWSNDLGDEYYREIYFKLSEIMLGLVKSIYKKIANVKISEILEGEDRLYKKVKEAGDKFFHQINYLPNKYLSGLEFYKSERNFKHKIASKVLVPLYEVYYFYQINEPEKNEKILQKIEHSIDITMHCLAFPFRKDRKLYNDNFNIPDSDNIESVIPKGVVKSPYSNFNHREELSVIKKDYIEKISEVFSEDLHAKFKVLHNYLKSIYEIYPENSSLLQEISDNLNVSLLIKHLIENNNYNPDTKNGCIEFLSKVFFKSASDNFGLLVEKLDNKIKNLIASEEYEKIKQFKDPSDYLKELKQIIDDGIGVKNRYINRNDSNNRGRF